MHLCHFVVADNGQWSACHGWGSGPWSRSVLDSQMYINKCQSPTWVFWHHNLAYQKAATIKRTSIIFFYLPWQSHSEDGSNEWQSSHIHFSQASITTRCRAAWLPLLLLSSRLLAPANLGSEIQMRNFQFARHCSTFKSTLHLIYSLSSFVLWPPAPSLHLVLETSATIPSKL